MVATSKTVAISGAIVAAAAFMQGAHAHTFVSQPLAEFKAGTKQPSSWVAEFQPPWPGKYKTGAQYAAEAKKRGIKDLRSFLESKGPVCGNTNPNARAKAIPGDGMVKFQSTLEHPGPCEIWLDNTRVYQNDDCEKSLGQSTSVKVNFSACKGKCMMRFYWLGLQDSGTRWQSYKNCIPLGGSGTKARSIDAEDDEYEYVPLESIANETTNGEYSFDD